MNVVIQEVILKVIEKADPHHPATVYRMMLELHHQGHYVEEPVVKKAVSALEAEGKIRHVKKFGLQVWEQIPQEATVPAQ